MDPLGCHNFKFTDAQIKLDYSKLTFCYPGLEQAPQQQTVTSFRVPPEIAQEPREQQPPQQYMPPLEPAPQQEEQEEITDNFPRASEENGPGEPSP